MTKTEDIQLTAYPRQTGKHFSRTHRTKMQIPAVVYGPKIENINLCLRENELVKYNKAKFENTIFTLNSEDKSLNGLKVLKKATSIHPVTRKPVHIDLYAMDMKATVRVSVEIKLEGKPEGVVDGGVLNAANREIEIECLPDDIPEFLSIDVTPLKNGEAYHVSDLTVPSGITILSSEKLTLCTVALIEEKEEAPAADAGDAAAAPAADAAAKPEGQEKKD